MELHTRWNDFWVYMSAETMDELREQKRWQEARVYEATETDLKYLDLEDNSNGAGI